MKRTIWIGLLALLAACGEPAAPTAQPTSTAPPIAEVGGRIESNGVAFTVVKVERAQDLGGISTDKPETEYIWAEVLIENIGAGDKFTTSPSQMRLRDGTGAEAVANYDSPEPRWRGGGFMLQGSQERGTVGWEIPAGATGLVLTYAPGGRPTVGPFRVNFP